MRSYGELGEFSLRINEISPRINHERIFENLMRSYGELSEFFFGLNEISPRIRKIEFLII
jgi:hypothetical protein